MITQSANVAEARKLKQQHVNAALLKEQLHSERLRANRAEAGLSDLANLQSRVTELESELKRWCEMIDFIPGAQSRDDVPRCIVELQRFATSWTATSSFYLHLIHLPFGRFPLLLYLYSRMFPYSLLT